MAKYVFFLFKWLFALTVCQTVYFGPLGDHATTLIDYFQRNGARNIEPQENVAEYMLDVIGAGATATSEIDWYNKWVESKEVLEVQKEIDNIHEEGRGRPPVAGNYLRQFSIRLTKKLSSNLHFRVRDLVGLPSYNSD